MSDAAAAGEGDVVAVVVGFDVDVDVAAVDGYYGEQIEVVGVFVVVEME